MGSLLRFWCPHCYRKDLQAPAADVDRVARNADATIACPSCARDISAREIANGLLKVNQGPTFLTTLVAFWGILGPVVLCWRFGWTVRAALGLAWGSVLLYALVKLAFPRR